MLTCTASTCYRKAAGKKLWNLAVLVFAVFASCMLLLHTAQHLPLTSTTNDINSIVVDHTEERILNECNLVGALANFLCQHGHHSNSIEPLFVTIADRQYIDPVRVFATTVQKSRPGAKLLVVCMDAECQRVLESHGLLAYSNYLRLMSTGASRNNIAELKFMLNIDLVEAGYHFVFFDGDVFATPGTDPLSGMLPIHDSSWDVQIQSDGRDSVEEGGPGNIGWYWMRPSANTAKFLHECLDDWRRTRHWDQAVFNHVLTQIRTREETPVRAVSVSRAQYVNFMHEWWTRISGDDLLILALRMRSTIIHFTCVEKAVKFYLAKYFGLWADLDGYYSRHRLLLAVSDLQGTPKEVALQFAAGLRIAQVTERSLIMPEWVHIKSLEHNITLPSYQFFHLDEISHLVLESRYLQNQASRGMNASKEVLIRSKNYTQAVASALNLSSVPLIQLDPILLETDASMIFDIKICTEWTRYSHDAARPGCMKVCGDAVSASNETSR